MTTTMARLAEFGLSWCVARPDARAAAPKVAPSLLTAIWASYGLGAVAAAFAIPATTRPLFVPAAMLLVVALASALEQPRA
ncbi:MAG: hypothetical protein ACHQAY_18140 [Hyphomicrobiales bacterium]